MEVAEGWPYFYDMRPIPLVKELGHYPFSSQFDLDCGLLGTTWLPGLHHRTDRRFTGPSRPFRATSEPPIRADERLVCLSDDGAGPLPYVFADEELRVVGAAAYGLERPDLILAGGRATGNYDVGFEGVAMNDASTYRAYAVIRGDNRLYAIPGELSPLDA